MPTPSTLNGTGVPLNQATPNYTDIVELIFFKFFLYRKSIECPPIANASFTIKQITPKFTDFNFKPIFNITVKTRP